MVGGAANKVAAAHARFAKAALLIYLGAAVVAVALLVATLVTDRNYQDEQTQMRLQLETEVRAYYLEQHLTLLTDELRRLGRRSEVDLLDANMAPERGLLEVSHAQSTFFNLGVAIVDVDGNVMWSEPETFLPTTTSLADTPWFLKARQDRDEAIVPVDPRAKDAVLYVVSPVVRDEQFTGALVGGMDLARGRPLDPEDASTMTVIATGRGQVVYPAVPPRFAFGSEWSDIFKRPSAQTSTTQTRLDDVPMVVAAVPLTMGNLVVLSVAPRDRLFHAASVHMRTRLLLGLALALAPLVALVLLLRRSLRELRRSEEQAMREERLQRTGEAANLIAHEVRNSLNGLKMGLDLVLREKSRPNERVVRELRAEIERLSGFTHQLMLFAKDPTPHRSDVDLSRLVPDALGFARDLAAELDVELSVTGVDEPLPARADPVLVPIAVSNLVSNALDAVSGATTDGPGRVEVDVTADDDQVAVRVSDNGPGVPAELRANLFEPFVTGKPSGVGIGLALARKIAQVHGGDLTLMPSERGAEFRLTLPRGAKKAVEGSA